MYGWVPLLATWNYHNIVNQLHSNTKFKKKFFLRVGGRDSWSLQMGYVAVFVPNSGRICMMWDSIPMGFFLLSLSWPKSVPSIHGQTSLLWQHLCFCNPSPLTVPLQGREPGTQEKMTAGVMMPGTNGPCCSWNSPTSWGRRDSRQLKHAAE